MTKLLRAFKKSDSEKLGKKQEWQDKSDVLGRITFSGNV